MSSTLASSFPQSNDSDATREAGAMSGSWAADNASRDAASKGQDLLGRVAQGAHATIDRFADAATPQLERLQEGVSSATEAVQARAGQLRETGDEWADSLRSTVRDNPIAALAAAVAVGMVVARLTRR